MTTLTAAETMMIPSETTTSGSFVQRDGSALAVMPPPEGSEWAALEAGLLADLNRARQPRTHGAGEVIFHQDSPCHGIFCLERGDVMLRKTDDAGHAVIVRLAQEGQTLGYRAFLEGVSHAATASAINECQVGFIDGAVFNDLLARSPTLSRRLLHRFARELREAEEQRLHAAYLTVRARLAQVLLQTRHRFGRVDDDGSLVVQLPFSRQDLAAFIGARRESVARAIAALRNDDVVQFQGRNAYVADLDALFDEVEPGPTS
ncbi:MAG: Crp/Fnr family transcriptional regulator [Acidobacteriota bacterium]